MGNVYLGVSSVAQKVEKMYIGVGGVAKKVNRAYIGVGGVAKLIYSASNSIEYIGKSSMASGIDSISVSVPSGYSNNDFLLLAIEGYNAAPSTPSGWTSIGSLSSWGSYLRVCYKVAGQSESSVTVADSGNSTRGIIFAFRGVSTSSPINSSNTEATNGVNYYTLSSGKLATTIANTMIVVVNGFYDSKSNDTSNITGFSTHPLSSITVAHDEMDNVGSGGGINVAYGLFASTGSVGTITANLDSNTYSAVLGVALTPAAT